MAEIIAFPAGRRMTQRGEHRVFVAGVDDVLVGEGLPGTPIRMDDHLAVRYVPAAQLERESVEPDLWIARPAPTGLDRQVLALTLADDILEQDDSGRLWLNGGQFQDGLLVDCGAVRELGTAVQPGSIAALMFMHREPRRCLITVALLGPILWIFAQPRTLSPRPVLEGWRTIATGLHDEA